MSNRNGQLVLDVLRSFARPATANMICKRIAQATGVTPDDVRDDVERTLTGGASYGFIKNKKDRYSLIRDEEDDKMKTEQTEAEVKGSDQNQELNENKEKKKGRKRAKSSCYKKWSTITRNGPQNNKRVRISENSQ